MKIFKNLSYPLKIRKTQNEAEDIIIWNNKDVFYNRVVNINNLDIDSSSKAIFITPVKNNITNIIVNSGDLLIIDKDTIILDTIIISNGGGMRVI
jgi:hypothetical protein